MWMTRVSIQNPVFATMVMVALCVLGLFSYSKLGVEQMPDISFPGAWIEIAYPGASPEAVERELTKPVEERRSWLDRSDYSRALESVVEVIDADCAVVVARLDHAVHKPHTQQTVQ